MIAAISPIKQLTMWSHLGDCHATCKIHDDTLVVVSWCAGLVGEVFEDTLR